jgi:hypothetical protein
MNKLILWFQELILNSLITFYMSANDAQMNGLGVKFSDSLDNICVPQPAPLFRNKFSNVKMEAACLLYLTCRERWFE